MRISSQCIYNLARFTPGKSTVKHNDAKILLFKSGKSRSLHSSSNYLLQLQIRTQVSSKDLFRLFSSTACYKAETFYRPL